MDDYRNIKIENDDRDEWADEFFSNVLSGNGRGRTRAGIYGQFDVIDKMSKGIDPDAEDTARDSDPREHRADRFDETPEKAPDDKPSEDKSSAGDRMPGKTANAATAPTEDPDDDKTADGSGVSDILIPAALFADNKSAAQDKHEEANGLSGSADTDGLSDPSDAHGNDAGDTDDRDRNTGAAVITSAGIFAETIKQSGKQPGAADDADNDRTGGTDDATVDGPHRDDTPKVDKTSVDGIFKTALSGGGSHDGSDENEGVKSANETVGIENAPEEAPKNEMKSGDRDGDDTGNEAEKGSKLFIAVAVIGIILLLVLAAICGFFLGKIVGNASAGVQLNSVDFTYENVDERQIAKLQTIYRFICDNYYDEVDADELLEGAVRGMADALGDPYGSYYRPGKMSDFTDFLDGRYNGIGIEIKRGEDSILVTDVNEDSPASRAGFMIGDEIVEVNGTAVKSIGNADLKSIFSSVGIEFTCRLKNGEGEREIRCTPEAITKKTVRMVRMDDGIVYVRIEQFITGTADEFRNALKEAAGEEVSGFIIDLRDNPGGFVNEAVMISDIILPEGTVAFAKQRDGKTVRSYDSDANHIDAPVVLLVNGRTASSSELLTGAFRDFDAGEIVGTKTYGKALAQITHEFDYDGSGIVLSAYRYYTPSGECIDGAGIEPTVEIVLPSQYEGIDVGSIPGDEDLQLLKAVEIIMSRYPEE